MARLLFAFLFLCNLTSLALALDPVCKYALKGALQLQEKENLNENVELIKKNLFIISMNAQTLKKSTQEFQKKHSLERIRLSVEALWKKYQSHQKNPTVKAVVSEIDCASNLHKNLSRANTIVKKDNLNLDEIDFLISNSKNILNDIEEVIN
ncbi:MAG: hypothetical protein H6621_09290 [Halobacteriovoraceae bacterium]|nr:hypothetical protein [Halobacteriovoraceae bacterium]MCB9095249.1 hypothetical protein [Halobacteriovoraceae bacterium]